MRKCVFAAGAVSRIHGVLHFGKALPDKVPAELSVSPPGRFCFDRKVKHHNDPHEAISGVFHSQDSSGSLDGIVKVPVTTLVHICEVST